MKWNGSEKPSPLGFVKTRMCFISELYLPSRETEVPIRGQNRKREKKKERKERNNSNDNNNNNNNDNNNNNNNNNNNLIYISEVVSVFVYLYLCYTFQNGWTDRHQTFPVARAPSEKCFW